LGLGRGDGVLLSLGFGVLLMKLREMKLRENVGGNRKGETMDAGRSDAKD
jgi:hypothetical protein